MPELERDGSLDLEYGVSLRSAGVAAQVGEVRQGAAAGAPVRSTEPGDLPEILADGGVPDDAANLLGSAARDAGLRHELSLPLDELSAAPEPGSPFRAAAEAPHVELRVPAPDQDEGQVVLEVDETGVVRWHLSEQAAAGQGTDRAEDLQIFRIPVEQLEIPAATSDRGILGFGFRKVLHVLRFPVEWAGGRAAEAGIGWWERRWRPYGLDLATPATLGQAITGSGVPASRLADLADKPFLLLLHGTFSRGRSAFAGLAADPALLAELHRRYDGRVLVFDHPTVHASCEANALELLNRLPGDRPLTLDVVAHSRGGLVGRQLAMGPLAQATGKPAPVVRTMVHVATPNAGTVLAAKGRLGDLLDMFTNLLSLVPGVSLGDAVEVLLEVVKQVATGVLGGLDGLSAMDPQGTWLRGLNSAPVPPGTAVHGIASDFESGDAPLAVKALDLLADGLFGVANDLVVPTEGVSLAGSYRVDKPFVLPGVHGVSHSAFFHDTEVRYRLAEWLPGA